jgi:hypothetical protein
LKLARAETAARSAAVADGARHAGLAQVLQTPGGFGLLKRLARQDAEAAAVLRDRECTVSAAPPLRMQKARAPLSGFQLRPPGF